MIMLLGIIEMALLMKDDVALTSAVRNGGRIASANAGAGPGGVAADDGSCTTPCTPGNAPKFAQLAANAIQSAGSALPKDSIQELWVYKANSKGYPCPVDTGGPTRDRHGVWIELREVQVAEGQGRVPLLQRDVALQVASTPAPTTIPTSSGCT